MNFALCFHLQLQNSVFCAFSGCLEGGGLKLTQALSSLWVERRYGLTSEGGGGKHIQALLLQTLSAYVWRRAQ